MRESIIPLFKVAMNPRVDDSLLKVLHSGYTGEGPKVKEFEERLAFLFNNKNCLALNSGTAGLRLALEMTKLETPQKKKVIATPLTCFATNAPILTSGNFIVWADIQKDSLNIDPDSIEEEAKNDVLAIIVVHWGGYPCDMDKIKKISEKYNIPVIEDGAHTFGSTYKGSIIGDCSYSDFCMISFQSIKFLSTGDGGVLFTKKKKHYDKLKLLRWFGIDRDSPRQDLRCEEDILQAGFKFQMNDLAATIGLSNLAIVQENLKTTRENVRFYRENLKDIPGITLIQNKTDRESSNWLFTILVDDALGFARKMGEKRIMVSKVHARNDKHSCTKLFQKYLPNLEKVEGKRVCLPVGWWVTKEDRAYIAESVSEGW